MPHRRSQSARVPSALQTLGNGGEVGEHTAEPTVVHVRHANALCLLGNSFLSLLLGANKEDGSTVSNGFLHEIEGNIDIGNGLLEVDDVDAVTFGQNEAASSSGSNDGSGARSERQIPEAGAW